MRFAAQNFLKNIQLRLDIIRYIIFTIVVTFFLTLFVFNSFIDNSVKNQKNLEKEVETAKKDLLLLKNQDQYLKNVKLHFYPLH